MWSWQLILYSLYVPILSTLWIIEIIFVIIYRKQFSSSYYLFFILCGLLSLINEFIINFATRLPCFPEVNSFFGIIPWIKQGQLPSLLYAFGHFFGGAHEAVNILISINRATAIILPHSHDKASNIWKYGIPLSHGVVFLIGAAGSWHLFNSAAIFFGFTIDDEVYYLMYQNYNSHPEINDTRNAVIVALVSPAITVPLYAISIAVLRKKWAVKRFRGQFSLLLLGFSSVLLCLPIALHQLYVYIRGPTMSPGESMTFYRMLPLLFDMRFFSPSLIILITDSHMRRKLVGIFGRGERILQRHPQNTISSKIVLVVRQ